MFQHYPKPEGVSDGEHREAELLLWQAGLLQKALAERLSPPRCLLVNLYRQIAKHAARAAAHHSPPPNDGEPIAGSAA